MKEQIDNLCNNVNDTSDKASNFLWRSVYCVVKVVGQGLGYSERLVSSVAVGTKGLFTFKSKSSPKAFSTGGMRKKFGLNKNEIQEKITDLENKIRDLYLDIGQIGANHTSEAALFNSKEFKQINQIIKKYEDEIFAYKKYLRELDEASRLNKPAPPISFLPGQTGFQGAYRLKMQGLINNSIRSAKFSLRSDAIIYEKCMYDLLDGDMDIKRLAVSEIGKLKNKNAALILKEAIKLDDPPLQAEIINSLIQLDDPQTFNICKEFIKHDYTAIRTACVRGLYKSGHSQAVPFLLESLKDINVEVRNSSCVFLGWIGDSAAIPSLLQAALDFDKRVRKNAILALTNVRDDSSILPMIRLLDDKDQEIRERVLKAIERISGENIKFDIHGNKNELARNIEQLKDWWIKKKHGVAALEKNKKEEQKISAPSPKPAIKTPPAPAEKPTAPVSADKVKKEVKKEVKEEVKEEVKKEVKKEENKGQI